MDGFRLLILALFSVVPLAIGIAGLLLIRSGLCDNRDRDRDLILFRPLRDLLESLLEGRYIRLFDRILSILIGAVLTIVGVAFLVFLVATGWRIGPGG